MHFLPDVWVECDTCRGQRYNPETLAVKFHGKSIADVLAMSCGEAVELFANIPKIRRILQTLCDVGLDYLTLGQTAPTLSGGEAQRVKLAAELARPDTGQTLYLLDEPTTGLHFDDLAKLLDVLNRLVDLGNTVIVIEHNLDVIKTADWVIDLGPEAGADGGYIVAEGTPEQVAKVQGQEERHRSATPRSRWPPSSPPARSSSGRNTTPPPSKCRAKTIRTSTTSAATRRCRGRSTAAAGTPATASTATASRANGTAGSSTPSRSASRTWANSATPIGTTARSSRSRAAKKSDGWFFHAITGERWLVKLKFRTAKRTFERDTLVAELGLKPLNDLDEIEAYGHGPRVKCKNLRGPWQEVQIDAHSWAEIDTPEFWSFVERAVAGFNKFTERVQQKPARRDALDRARPEVAPLEEGFPARQANRLEARGARRTAGDARTTPSRRASSSGTTRSGSTSWRRASANRGPSSARSGSPASI